MQNDPTHVLRAFVQDLEARHYWATEELHRLPRLDALRVVRIGCQAALAAMDAISGDLEAGDELCDGFDLHGDDRELVTPEAAQELRRLVDGEGQQR